MNHISNSLTAIAALAIAFMISSCSDDKFRISGEIENADNALVELQRPDAGGLWITIDSVRTSGTGEFSLKSMAPQTPEIYRLVMDSRQIYFPIDSTEHISLKTTAAGFGYDYTLAGSDQASLMAAFDMEAATLSNVDDPDSIVRFKKKVYNDIIRDSKGGLLSYYVLTKTLGNNLLYNPSDPQDSKYIAAVATSFKQFNPESPRTQFLEQLAMASIRNKNRAAGRYNELAAEELDYPEIELPDIAGDMKSLSATITPGRPAILVFSLLADPQSRAVNDALADIYTRHNEKIDIYQVGYDADVHQWSEVAKGLPWVCVFDMNGASSTHLSDYNVEQLPQFYIFNARGELADKAYSTAELVSKLR